MHQFRVVVIAAVASVALVAAAGCNGKAGRPAPAVQTLDEAATAVRLQATIYEVRLAPEKIAELDAARLAKTDLSKHLPELGQSRVLYLVDQQVSLAGDEVVVGTQEPVVTNSRVTASGRTVNTMAYTSVGASIDFKAERLDARRLGVTSAIEISAQTDSPVEVSPGVATPIQRRATMSLKGPVELGKPSVLISADASSRDKEGRAIVYLARLVLGGASPAAK